MKYTDPIVKGVDIVKACMVILVFILSVIVPFSTHHSVHAHDQTAQTLQLNAQSAILMDNRSGAIIYEKNAHSSMYPASLTKIVTAIIAIEEGNLNEVVTVSSKARNVEGTRVYLNEGEKVRLKTLIQGLLINSGNDAAVAIAEHLSGSVEQFAKKMNQFVKDKVGLKHSSFRNPHGLFHESHVTTAYDLAMITKYAMKNKIFKQIFGTKKLAWNGDTWKTTIYNHNQLLWRYEGVNGGKTGYVQKSGNTLVTTAKRKNLELIAVVLREPSKEASYQDTIKLFDYGFSTFVSQKISNKTFLHKENGENYYIPEPVFFTKLKGEQVNLTVVNRTIQVVGKNNRIIAEQIPLKKLSKKTFHHDLLHKQQLNQFVIKTKETMISLFISILITAIFSVILSVYIKQKQKISSL